MFYLVMFFEANCLHSKKEKNSDTTCLRHFAVYYKFILSHKWKIMFDKLPRILGVLSRLLNSDLTLCKKIKQKLYNDSFFNIFIFILYNLMDLMQRKHPNPQSSQYKVI